MKILEAMLSPDHGVFTPMCQNTVSQYPDSSRVDTHGSTDEPHRASCPAPECQHDHHRPRTGFKARVQKLTTNSGRPGRQPSTPALSLLLMILLQVHLQKPCYDFYFL